MIHQAMLCQQSRPRYAYIFPFRNQAKMNIWPRLKDKTKDFPSRYVNEADLLMRLPGDREFVVFGADNPDALRGNYLDGVIFDEYQDTDPSVWSKVIRPQLVDRQGWAMFIGTPKGHNDLYKKFQYARGVKIDPDDDTNESLGVATDDWTSFLFRASDTGIIPPDELAAIKRDTPRDDFMQEYECDFEAAIKGAYFGHEMRDALDQKRIGVVPHDPGLPVGTAWDLGIGDATAIWFFQTFGGQYRIIDYVEESGAALPYFAGVLLERARPPFNYRYRNDWHFAPHDARARDLGTGRTREEVARSLGIPWTIVPQVSHKDDSIHAARMLLPRCWFDEQRCAVGVEHLRQYRAKWDEARQVLSRQPQHDEHSHGADAFQTLAMANPIGHSPATSGGALPPAYED